MATTRHNYDGTGDFDTIGEFLIRHYQPGNRDSWGFVPGTEGDSQRWLASPTFDPSLWKVGWEGDEVAGMVLNFFNQAENQEYGRKRGWTDPICVRIPWRRRGLARALLVQSIHMFRIFLRSRFPSPLCSAVVP